jgi:hypothetical protein
MAVDLHHGELFLESSPGACCWPDDSDSDRIPQQGIITICLGIMGYIFIVDFPDRSTQPQLVTRRPFLTPEEAEMVKARIDRDRGDAVVDSLDFQKVLHHLRDWKLWEWAWLYLLNNVVTYSFGFFLPIILSGDMGYSTTMAQILSFPPYVAAAPWMLSTAWFADRYRKRGLVLIFNASAAIVGVAMMGFIRSSPGARYAGVFLGVCGCNSNVPTILSYMHNNIVGQSKRSIASALIIGGGAIGGIIASNIFRQADAPEYTPAMIAAIMTQAITMGRILWCMRVLTRRLIRELSLLRVSRDLGTRFSRDIAWALPFNCNFERCMYGCVSLTSEYLSSIFIAWGIEHDRTDSATQL